MRDEQGPVRGRRSRLALSCALVIAATAGCKELEVFPQRLQVAVNASGTTTIDVTARYRKKKGGEILNDRITWQTDAAGVVFYPTPSGRDAKIIIPSGSTGEIRVKVYAGSKSDELRIEIVAPTGDRATALDHGTPSVLMIVGDAGNCPSEKTVSFVRGGALEPRQVGCATSDVVRLSAYAPPTRSAIAWTSSADIVDFPTVVALQAQEVRVWLLQNDEYFASSGFTSNAVDAIVLRREEFLVRSLEHANGVLFASRTGMRLEQVGPAVRVPSTATNCDELLAELALDDETTGVPDGIDVWRRDAINVYVMERYTGSRGQYCRPVGGAKPRNVIRLQEPDALESSLAHEVGHMWGLVVPWGVNAKHTGHVDRINAFQQDNVMWAGVDLETTAPRTRFSIGQVYRMHFDQRSELATVPGTDCGCDPFAQTCGRLSREVRPISRSAGALGASLNACEAP